VAVPDIQDFRIDERQEEHCTTAEVVDCCKQVGLRVVQIAGNLEDMMPVAVDTVELVVLTQSIADTEVQLLEDHKSQGQHRIAAVRQGQDIA
jgi:hypothetical protein